ncbi:recombination regulator RecX [Testudinibacter sp. TR-2022]|uniref:recombination regulator RecX n=2 Tax=Testudinibacter sp. TR-2022 TaxID=2585029 RepID=UPI001118381C|nr:recombination regulator RecX [Testudinibacter sp. TR-2022]TNH01462.1 recombination regulator RecX [Pasteurellaceae bacterium Phil31]TNH06472.1 recombination regulator RecX [Testudinibacter sp. TR-2022]TNH09897.1 recombination regulator RecX [Testudinibacter sp. TR-2022]TNH12970.1 recombination regulator RecX [Testudinibacter sp. TR-2022]
MNNIALSYLLNLLARRDYSVYEIQQKMRAKAFSEAEIETVIEHCQLKGWQSDQRFCQHFLLARSRKGYGPLRIRQELQQKGIETALIAQQLATDQIDWFALAEQVFAKKYGDHTPTEWTPVLKQKAWRFMLSRGFQTDHFSHLLKIECN